MSSSSSPFSILVIPLDDLMICGDSGGVGVGVDDGLHLPTAMLVDLHSSCCIISDGGGGGGGLGVAVEPRETSSNILRCGGLYFGALGILDFFKGDGVFPGCGILETSIEGDLCLLLTPIGVMEGEGALDDIDDDEGGIGNLEFLV